MFSRPTYRPVITLAIAAAFSIQAFAASSGVDVVAKSVSVSQSKAETQSPFKRTLRLEAQIFNYHYENVPYPAVEKYYLPEWVEVVSWVPVATTTHTTTSGKDATNPSWSGFFNAKKDDKAQALANAIKGVGVKTAEKLIKAGYFGSKPKSWSQFKSVIERAAKDPSFGDSSLDNNVINQHGEANEAALYGKPAKHKHVNGVSYELRSQLELQNVLYEREVIRYKEEKISNFSHSVMRDVTFEVLDTKLLNGESETFTLRFDSNNISVSPSKNANSYAVIKNEQDNFGNQLVIVQATRLQVVASNTLVIENAFSSGGKAQITLRDTFSDQGSEIGETVVVWELVKNPYWGFNKVIATGSAKLALGGQSQVINTGAKIDGRSFMRVYLQRRNSAFFTSSVTETKVESANFK